MVGLVKGGGGNFPFFSPSVFCWIQDLESEIRDSVYKSNPNPHHPRTGAFLTPGSGLGFFGSRINNDYVREAVLTFGKWRIIIHRYLFPGWGEDLSGWYCCVLHHVEPFPLRAGPQLQVRYYTTIWKNSLLGKNNMGSKMEDNSKQVQLPVVWRLD